MTSVDDCKLIDLRQTLRPQGNLTPIEGGQDIPFEIERVYYLYDIPAGVARAGHGHRALEQLFVCVLGAFTIILRDGKKERWIEMNRAYQGLYVPPMIWRELGNFSAGSICLVLASRHYEEADYFRDYREFEALKQGDRPADAVDDAPVAPLAGFSPTQPQRSLAVRS